MDDKRIPEPTDDGAFVPKSVTCIMARKHDDHAQCQQNDCECECHPPVCRKCQRPATLTPEGWAHAEYADAVACALFSGELS